jgi:thiol-disulfide isomerase/thioredoxin
MQTKSGIIIAAIAVVLVLVAGVALRFGAPPESTLRLVGEVRNFELAQERRTAPAEAWHDAAGAAVSLGDFRGQVVLLNLWASWCAPCLRELPSLNALQAGLGGGDFRVIALNIDRDGEKSARPMVQRLELDRLELYLDPENRLPRELGIRVMPTTILYDRGGREIGRLQGPAEWNAPEAQGLISFFVDHPDYLDR